MAIDFEAPLGVLTASSEAPLQLERPSVLSATLCIVHHDSGHYDCSTTCSNFTPLNSIPDVMSGLVCLCCDLAMPGGAPLLLVSFPRGVRVHLCVVDVHLLLPEQGLVLLDGRNFPGVARTS